MKTTKVFLRNKNIILIIILLIVIATIIVGNIVMPEVFYDQWIWKYYWGPIVADATPNTATAVHNGVIAREGYTLISEITYGLILILSLYLIYKLLKKLEIKVNWRFCLALMPYILFGSFSRVLEDSNYFNEPFIYWFISPLIYVQIAVYALGFLLLGYYLERLSKKQIQKKTLLYTAFIFIFIDACYTIIWFFGLGYPSNIIHPFIFYLLSFLSFIPLLYRFSKKQILTMNTVLFSGGLLFLFPTLFLIGVWILDKQWSDSAGVRVDVLILVIGLTGILVGLVYLIARKYNKNEKIAVYRKPLNLAMLFGHLIDGLTSYISIFDPFNMGIIGYAEKHPASFQLMEIWPPLFPIMKFFLIIIVIYVFDVLYKEELKKHMSLVNLLKIGILILGLSPGLRDLLRVTLGV